MPSEELTVLWDFAACYHHPLQFCGRHLAHKCGSSGSVAGPVSLVVFAEVPMPLARCQWQGMYEVLFGPENHCNAASYSACS
jgi:hypothetical protein